jgi:hypothetical protein
MVEENLELELKYNSVFDIIKDFEYVRYKIYFGLTILFLVSCIVFYVLFIEKVQIDKLTLYVVFFSISIPFIISTFFDFLTRRIKIRIYPTHFEIPVGRPSSYQRNNSRAFQRIMKKYRYLKLKETRQYKHTYTLVFLHETEDILTGNKSEFTIKSLTHLEISKLDKIFKEKLAFTREPYYTRKF